MNEFLLIFRRDYITHDFQPTLQQLDQHFSHWQAWFTQLAKEDRLARQLQRWDINGKLISKDKIVKDGPYMEVRESVGGLVIIRAMDYQEAVDIAMGCPILELGGNVEIRMGGLNRE